MNLDPRVRELLTCAVMHLDPRMVDKQVVLNSVLVEVALLEVGRSATAEELCDKVDCIVNQRDFLPEQDLDRALQACLRTGAVACCEDRYQLSEPRAEALHTAFEAGAETKRRVRDELRDSIELEVGKPLPGGLADAVCDSIERALASSVYELSLQLARENVTMEEMLFRLDSVERLEELDAALDKELGTDRALRREEIKHGVSNYFRRFSPALEERLNLVHHQVLINQILNLDPSMVRLQREWFSRRRLYLDTNVVLAYLFEGQELHSVVLEVIKATISVGTQLLISPATLRELEGQVARAKRNYLSYERDPLVRQAAASGDDAILATYVQLKRKQPALEWDAFIAQFEDLALVLLEYDILVEEEGFEGTEDWEGLPRVRQEIADAKWPWGTDTAVDHDSLVCALIFHLREVYSADERGQVVWLLSIDRSLRTAQRNLYGADVMSGPYCLQIQDWGEIVLPAQNLLGFVFHDFIGYLARARLGALADPQVVQLDFLETIRDAGVDVDRLVRLHPSQVRATLARLQTNRDARALATSAAEAEQEDRRRAYQQQLELMVDEAIEETDPIKLIREEYDQKLEILRRRVDGSEQAIAERDETIEELSNRLARAEATWGFRLSSWFGRLFGRN